jgi:hypothetical protein
MSKTLKSYRVGYYFPNEIRDGRVRLRTSYVEAFDAEQAKMLVRANATNGTVYLKDGVVSWCETCGSQEFNALDGTGKTCPNGCLDNSLLVFVSAYRERHKRIAHREYWIKVHEQQAVTTSASSNVTIKADVAFPATLQILRNTPTTFGLTGVTPFKGEIVRPTGPCQWHPNAHQDPDGRCTAAVASSWGYKLRRRD